MTPSSFRDFLQRLITAKGWTQRDFAAALSEAGSPITDSGVSLWLSGRNLPSKDRLPTIGDVFELGSMERARLIEAFMAAEKIDSEKAA